MFPIDPETNTTNQPGITRFPFHLFQRGNRVQIKEEKKQRKYCKKKKKSVDSS